MSGVGGAHCVLEANGTSGPYVPAVGHCHLWRVDLVAKILIPEN